MFAAFYNQSPLVTMVLWMAAILEPIALNEPAVSEKRIATANCPHKLSKKGARPIKNRDLKVMLHRTICNDDV